MIKGGDPYPRYLEIAMDEENLLDYRKVVYDKEAFQAWAAKLKSTGGTGTMDYATPKSIEETKIGVLMNRHRKTWVERKDFRVPVNAAHL